MAVGRWDGSTWTLFNTDGIAAQWSSGLAIARDGTVWLATDRGLARLHGERWELPCAGPWYGSLSAAADGTVWINGAAGLYRLRPSGLTCGGSGVSR